MTILDALKYPVGLKCTQQEYDAVPDQVRQSWVVVCRDKFNMQQVFDSGYYFYRPYWPARDLLIKMILEYNCDDL